MKKRILITTSTFPRWEGDSTTPFVAQFAGALSTRGHHITVLSPHAKGAAVKEHYGSVEVHRYRYFLPSKAETLAYGGGAILHIKKTPLYVIKLVCLASSLLINTYRLALRNRVDVINAHWIIPQGFLAVIAGWLTRKKVVITVHGGDIFELNGRLLRKIKAFALSRAHAVVVNSSATLSACRAVCPRDYTLIPMGVDMNTFRPQPPSKVLRTQYGLGRFTILFIGRLTKQKGTQYLLEALYMLKRAGVDFKALIIGDGPERERLEEYVEEKELGREVVFIGWVDAQAIRDYYALADIFVGPSIVSEKGAAEAFGLVFVEAMACGLPVLATHTGGIIDIVEDGINGVLVAERSAEEIFVKLNDFYMHPDRLKSLAKHCRQSAVERFSWESVIDRYGKVFET